MTALTRHSCESGSPFSRGPSQWMPAYAGMTEQFVTSFPRKRESIFQRPKSMDARLRGHDENKRGEP